MQVSRKSWVHLHERDSGGTRINPEYTLIPRIPVR